MASVILVVDDHPAMLHSIRINLEMAGYEVVTADNGVEALEVLNARPVNLILADIAMPRMNGYQLYEQVRQNRAWALIPFVFVSARTLDSDIRYGKTLGADDYLVKPFHVEDLLAVVAGRLRRAQELEQIVGQPASPEPSPAVGNLIAVGPLRINRQQHRVWRDGVLVELSPREFTFLEYLARRPEQAVSLTELCQVTHGLTTDAIEAGNLLYPLVRSLRRRLGYAAGETGGIESVRGIGYRLVS